MVELTAEEDLPEMVAGDHQPFDITFTDENDDPIDISSWSFTVTVKESRSDSDADAVIQKQVTSHTSPASGKSFFEFTAAETSGLQGNYEYDIEVDAGIESPRTVLEGQAFWRPGVTNQ